MIESLIQFSIRNKFIVILAMIGLVAWGAYSITQIPIDAVPDITNNQVQVITQSPSLSAPEVEQQITLPLEIAFGNVQGVTEIRSISRFGLSVITVVFEETVNPYLARQIISEKINQVIPNIPKSLGIPQLGPLSTGLGEIYQYVLYPAKGYEEVYSPMELRTIQDWIVKRRLSNIEGVVDVSSFGGFLKQYEVTLDPEMLRSYNLSIGEVFDALEKNNENIGGSYIEKGPNVYFVRGEGRVENNEDIENIVIKNSAGIPLTIGQVAKVNEGHAPRFGALTRNGKGEVAGGIVLMLKGENSAKVIDLVKERVAEIKKTLPQGVVMEAYLDRSLLVDRAIHTVTVNLIEGGIIVILVLVLLLGNFRAGLLVASVIPLSMMFAISMMNLFGVSANLMSLGAIDFGLIVDGSVIIVEAIIFRLAVKHGNTTMTQEEMDRSVFKASSKIRKSAAFGEIIILIVYLPILALSGVEGKMFKPMAQTVSFAILGALILSLTYVPMMSALFLQKKIVTKKNWSDRIMEKLYGWYQPLLLFSLKRKASILIVSLVSFILSILLFLSLGGEFIPTLDEGDFAIETRLPPGSSLSQTIATSQKAEKILLEFPEVKQVVSKIGTAEIPTDPMPLEANDLMVILKDKSEWVSAKDKDELAEKMKEALGAIPGANFDFQQPIEMRFNELMTGVKSDIAVKIYGEDLELLSSKAKEIESKIHSIEGVGDLKVEQLVGMPQIQINYNRRKLAQYNLSIQDLNKNLKAAFAGEKAGVVIEGEKIFDLVVRFDKNHRSDIDDIKNLYVDIPGGEKIPLQEVAQIEYKDAPIQISRDFTKRRITIGINARNRDVQSIVEDIKIVVDKEVKLPAGYYITYGGQFENLEKAKERLLVAVPVALFLIFVLLYFTFHSAKYSLIIFSAIPLASIGGILLLWLRGMPFSISAGVGFIALFGVAVLNGIVMISYFNKLKDEGKLDLHGVILEGTKERFRPVILTAAVASLGFLPMALSGSAGAEVQKPLATVVIGGLISATLLTLVVLPVLYLLFTKETKNA